MSRFVTHLSLFLLLTPWVSFGQTKVEFKAADPLGRSTVQFRTTAPLEDIIGMTNEITGSIKVDPANLMNGKTAARFEVKMASLDTGIGLRNSDLRDNYLHTDKYPKAVFTLEKIIQASATELKPGSAVSMIVAGTFELREVRRKIEVSVTVTYLTESPLTRFKLPGNLLRVTSEFDVKLADYDIDVPRLLILSVGDVAHVSVDAFTSDASPEEMSAWMDQLTSMRRPPEK